MLLISHQFVDNIVRFKAPQHKMYHVSSIAASNLSAVVDHVHIFSESLEAEDDLDATLRISPFATFTSSAIGNFQIQGIDDIMKYISIGKSNAASVNMWINIYGELKKATKKQLIMEWFMKGR